MGGHPPPVPSQPQGRVASSGLSLKIGWTLPQKLILKIVMTMVSIQSMLRGPNYIKTEVSVSYACYLIVKVLF